MKTDIATIQNDIGTLKLQGHKDIAMCLYELNASSSATQCSRMAALMLAGPELFLVAKGFMFSGQNLDEQKSNAYAVKMLELLLTIEKGME